MKRMKSIRDVALKLKKYPQISYDANSTCLSYETPLYQITYTEQLITIFYGGKQYEQPVADYDEGYFFFKQLLKGKISIEEAPLSHTTILIKNFHDLNERKFRRKPVGIIGKILGTFLALALIGTSLFFLFCFAYLLCPETMAVDGTKVDGTDLASILFFLVQIALGCLLLHHVYTRHPMRWCDIFLIAFGFLLALFFIALSITEIIYWNEPPQIPLGGMISLLVIFLMFVAIGIFLMYIGFAGSSNLSHKANFDLLLTRKPQFPPMEQAKALYERILAISPEILTLSSDKQRTRTSSITDSKIGGEMYWEQHAQYPQASCDHDGDVMLYPILQLNLKDLPENHTLPLPRTGILQLFTSGDGIFCDIVYHKEKEIAVRIKMPHRFDADASYEKGDAIYTRGEIPITVQMEKAIFYSKYDRMQYSRMQYNEAAMMQQAAEELEINLSEDLTFWELADFVGARIPYHYIIGALESQDGNLDITLYESFYDDWNKNGIEIADEGYFTWNIRAFTLETKIYK